MTNSGSACVPQSISNTTDFSLRLNRRTKIGCYSCERVSIGIPIAAFAPVFICSVHSSNTFSIRHVQVIFVNC